MWTVSAASGNAEMQVVIATAGVQSGYRTADEIKSMFQVDVGAWPLLFRIGKTGLVLKLPRHEQLYQQHTACVQRNWQALGLR